MMKGKMLSQFFRSNISFMASKAKTALGGADSMMPNALVA